MIQLVPVHASDGRAGFLFTWSRSCPQPFRSFAPTRSAGSPVAATTVSGQCGSTTSADSQSRTSLPCARRAVANAPQNTSLRARMAAPIRQRTSPQRVGSAISDGTRDPALARLKSTVRMCNAASRKGGGIRRGRSGLCRVIVAQFRRAHVADSVATRETVHLDWALSAQLGSRGV